MHKYIDIGVNLTAGTFSKDVPAVIDRALAAGVEKLVITGTDMASNEQAIRLCQDWPQTCYCTAGIHPHHASDYSASMRSELVEMQTHPVVVAAGECGLDFNRNYSSRSDQLRAFEAQVDIALDTGKPLFLHQRDAHDDFRAVLASAGPDLGQAVAHCFTGNVAQARDYIDMGLFIGITGWICDDRRGHELRNAVSAIPLERLMLETDAPYLLPRDLPADYEFAQALKKRRNEPCLLPHIAAVVAANMGVKQDELVSAVHNNTLEFFSLAGTVAT